MSLAKVQKNGWLTLVLKGISSFLGGQMMSDFSSHLEPSTHSRRSKMFSGCPGQVSTVFTN